MKKRILKAMSVMLVAATLMTGTGFNEVVNVKAETVYDENGYDANGYDKNGYDKDGYDKDGYNSRGYDRDGYDREGYDFYGRDRDGFSRQGYDKDGYDRDGYRNGVDRDGYYVSGYNKAGYDRNGYDKYGYDANGYDKDGYDRAGYGKDGYNRDGYDKDGYDRSGYDKNGYNRNGYDKDGYNRKGYDKNGYDKNGKDETGKTKAEKEKENFPTYFGLENAMVIPNKNRVIGRKEYKNWFNDKKGRVIYNKNNQFELATSEYGYGENAYSKSVKKISVNKNGYGKYNITFTLKSNPKCKLSKDIVVVPNENDVKWCGQVGRTTNVKAGTGWGYWTFRVSNIAKNTIDGLEYRIGNDKRCKDVVAKETLKLSKLKSEKGIAAKTGGERGKTFYNVNWKKAKYIAYRTYVIVNGKKVYSQWTINNIKAKGTYKTDDLVNGKFYDGRVKYINK